MLDLAPWRDRCTAVMDTGTPVSLAATVDSAKKAKALPSLQLVAGRDRVRQQPQVGGTRHRVTAEVMLVSAVPRHGQAALPEGSDMLTALREPSLGALIGWLPPGGEIEIHWNGGQLLALADHALFWVDVLSTDYWWRTTP
ncbi:hypothetical protein FZZ93_02415 [Halomonas eurihalina]|uniref:Uncharacterized protein n=1 Tax=Halomonas eurihalina TaxID=42566 RepID=A0A5D9DCM1_HALER|nr:hypothetical protein [Halomonas eurihalina]MDR5857952.1 hypothetical protein [Halomonas eurihalina]TZG41536.1 hypothetical protein FZZ93_02415 [Halomonas eurihalina]